MLDVLLAALLLQVPGAKQPSTSHQDACLLIADADVQSVLGVAVKEHIPGTQQARGVLLSQCYLGTGTMRSVSIAVAGPMRSGNKTVTPRAFWREEFHERRERASGDAGEREQEQEIAPRPIAGVGDEAFWSGTRVAGALYALRGNTFIRVSVGGIGDERERIEKSRQLALRALTRLR